MNNKRPRCSARSLMRGRLAEGLLEDLAWNVHRQGVLYLTSRMTTSYKAIRSAYTREVLKATIEDSQRMANIELCRLQCPRGCYAAMHVRTSQRESRPTNCRT